MKKIHAIGVIGGLGLCFANNSESEKERGKTINPAFEKEPIPITNPYSELRDMDFGYNPEGKKQNTNRQAKKKKRKRKGQR